MYLRVLRLFSSVSKIREMEVPCVPARVVKIMGRIGASGIMTEVRVELLKFPRMHTIRAVKGPVRLGDIIKVHDQQGDISMAQRIVK